MARRAAKKGNVISLDFTDVETRGRFHEAGDYHMSVKAATQEEGQKDPYISWELTCVEGDSEGAIVYNNTSLSPQSLWNVKAFLEALGVDVPDDAFDLDLDDCIDMEFMGKIEMEPYEGKDRPRLVDFWPYEEKKATGKKRGAKKDDADDEEPPKSRRGSKKAPDEEDEAPKRGRRGAKEPEPEEEGLTEDAVNDMSEEELEDVIKENKLGKKIDLSDFTSLRKMRAGLIELLTEEDLLVTDEEPEPEEKPKRTRTRSRR